VCPLVKTALHQPSGETGCATPFRSTLIGRPSVCLSRRSTTAAAAGGFAVESHVGRRYRSIGAGAVLQLQAFRRSAANAGGVAFIADGEASSMFCSVLFCSLAVLNPRVGHTMDALSPFVSVLCHSD